LTKSLHTHVPKCPGSGVKKFLSVFLLLRVKVGGSDRVWTLTDFASPDAKWPMVVAHLSRAAI